MNIIKKVFTEFMYKKVINNGAIYDNIELSHPFKTVDDQIDLVFEHLLKFKTKSIVDINASQARENLVKIIMDEFYKEVSYGLKEIQSLMDSAMPQNGKQTRLINKIISIVSTMEV